MIHPNSIRTTHSIEYTVLAADGAQANLVLQPVVASNQRKKVLDIYATAHGANSVNVAVRVGFGASALPAAALAAGAEGILLSHGSVLAGSGFFGIPGIGAAGEDLFLTCGIPTGGDVRVSVLYELETV